MVKRMLSLPYMLQESLPSQVNQKLREDIIYVYECIGYDGEEWTAGKKKKKNIYT